MPQVVNLIFLTALAAIVILEIKRGIAKAALDLLTLYAALVSSGSAAPLLARHASFAPDPQANLGWSFAVSFVAFSIFALSLSRRLDAAMKLEAGVMSGPLGGVAGLGVAGVVLHAAALSLHAGGLLAGSSIGAEALNFSTYHNIASAFSSVANRPHSPASG